MDDDEIEMTSEELQIFIRDTVNCKLLVSDNLMKKYTQLQSLLERKDKLSIDIIELSESVSKYEARVKKMYSTLGWEYKDADSEGDGTDDIRSVSPVSNDFTDANSDEENPEETTEVRSTTPEESAKFTKPRKELRVVLERLDMDLRPRRTPKPSTSKQLYSDDELSNAGSEYNPSESSSDSDFLIIKSDKQKKKKSIKLEKSVKKENSREMPEMPQTKPALSPTMPAQPACSVQPKASEPTTKTNVTNEAKASEPAPTVKQEMKAEMKPFAVNDKNKPAQVLPFVPQELKGGVMVLARRKKIWESGTIAEIVEKEDGTKKYKITFEDKGKMLVSGHHIAFNAMPKLLHLAVGCRVVSKIKPENKFFSPGILGELPSRKNHMRFLIFFDDQKTLYVALPALRVVYQPLDDPLDDIRDEEHRSFLKEYLQRMPYPPHTQFRVDQKIKVVKHGVLESCTVALLDCSLMEVVYEKDGKKEWIYRGSIRLEHIKNMKEQSKK